jgi:integrase
LSSINNFNLKSKAWGNLRIILKGMFLYAKKKGYTNFSITLFLDELELSKNMFSHEKKPDENTIYSQKEIDDIVKYIGNSKNLTDLAILFAIYTGMRVGEIVALKWEDVGEDFISVNRTQIRYKVDGKVVHEIRDFPKTESGIRNVVIVPELKEVLKRIRSTNTFTEYVFDRRGNCIPKHSICTKLYYICDKLNIERRGMHSIRKYYATKLINAGIEEIIIINQMGHADFSTTKNFYYKNNNEKAYIFDRVSWAISQ